MLIFWYVSFQVRARIRRHRRYMREQKYGDEPEQLDMDLSGGNKFLEVTFECVRIKCMPLVVISPQHAGAFDCMMHDLCSAWKFGTLNSVAR